MYPVSENAVKRASGGRAGNIVSKERISAKSGRDKPKRSKTETNRFGT
jgi:hypothetical protein